MDTWDYILIHGLEFYGYHGDSDQEQTVGHRFRVDVRMAVDIRSAGVSDRLEDTINYAQVSLRIVEIGTQSQFRLVEALAEALSAAILTEFVPVQQVQLRLEKLFPPMNAIANSVGVEI